MKVILLLVVILTAQAKAIAQRPDENAPTIQSTVSSYLLSPRGEVEGLLLADNSAVRLPPHLSGILAKTVRVGDSVTVVAENIGPTTEQGRGVKAYSVANNTNGKMVVDTPPASPTPRPEARGFRPGPLLVKGNVKSYLVNEAGDVDGVILSHGEQVKLPPHMGRLVLDKTKDHPSVAFAASGWGVRNRYGTVVDRANLRVDGKVLQDNGPLPGRDEQTPAPSHVTE